jgi:hypothetical protein
MTYTEQILKLKADIPGSRFFQALDKMPIKSGSWKDDATDNPAEIEKRWEGQFPCQVGMVLPPGMVAIDVDTKEGKVGGQSLISMMSNNPAFSDFITNTRRHRTISRGAHFFGYDRKGLVDGQPDLAEDINLRTGGLGYVIAPPSEGYSVEADKPILDFPDAFYDLYELAKREKTTQSERTDDESASVGAWMRDGDGRNNALASYLGSKRHYNPEYNSDTMMTIARQ